MKSKDDDRKEEEKEPTDVSYGNTARDMTEPGDDDSDDTIEIKVGHQNYKVYIYHSSHAPPLNYTKGDGPLLRAKRFKGVVSKVSKLHFHRKKILSFFKRQNTVNSVKSSLGNAPPRLSLTAHNSCFWQSYQGGSTNF